MTLKPQCDCSTCACGNAPGRSGYCLNCEVTDSGAEGSHAQHTPGPWYATTLTHDGETYSHVQSASINEDNYVARVDVMDEQGEANAALISAAPAMYEALKAVESEITRLERISKQAFSIDEVHPAVGRVADATRAAIAAAEGK
jgi:hypothetical protein